VFKILDSKKTVVDFNSRWFSKFSAEDFIRLTAKYTVSQMLEREDFHKRFREEKPIAMHELLYPLAQDTTPWRSKPTWNWVHRSEIQFTVGRELQRAYGHESQVVLTTRFWRAWTASIRCRSRWEMRLGFNEPPLEMYGKIMSISDAMMWRYYELLTDVQVSEINDLRQQVSRGDQHPMALKQNLARQIVGDFHTVEAAMQAEVDWARQFRDRKAPESIEVVEVHFADIKHAHDPMPAAPRCWVKLDKLLHRAGLASSATDAQRKREQGSVRIAGDVMKNPVLGIDPPPQDMDIRVGRTIKRVHILP